MNPSHFFWFTLLPHRRRRRRSLVRFQAFCLCVWSWHVLPLACWVLICFSSFLLHSRNMHVRWRRNLPVNVSVNGCLSPCCPNKVAICFNLSDTHMCFVLYIYLYSYLVIYLCFKNVLIDIGITITSPTSISTIVPNSKSTTSPVESSLEKAPSPDWLHTIYLNTWWRQCSWMEFSTFNPKTQAAFFNADW